MTDCSRRDDGRFVCENHPEQPFFGDRTCPCGGAGVPCPACNASQVTMPEMPEDFGEELTFGGGALEGDSARPVYRPARRPTDEAGHYIKCPECGGWIDCRDLGVVSDHTGPLPHPAADRAH